MGRYPKTLGWLLLAALAILTCSDSDKSVEPQIDNSIPAQISDLNVDNNDEYSVLLSWSASGDDGDVGEVSTYEVCWSSDYDLVYAMDSTAHLVGHELSGSPGESLSLEVMVGDTQLLLYFSVRAVDEAGNRGEVSNVAVLNSAYLGRPDPIDDLHVECLPMNSMKLVWTTPPIENDDVPAVSYDIRVSPSEITEENFLEAELVPDIPQPIQVGATEELVVENLTEGETYFFGIRAIGYNEDFYSYSNFISANCNDETAPATVDDFVIVYVNSTDITLGWTAVGDDDSIGTASHYDLRMSADSITEANWSEAAIVSGLPAPKAAGEVERFDVPYSADDSVLHFGLKVADEAGNVSGLATLKYQRNLISNDVIWSKGYDDGGDEMATCATEVVDGFLIAGTIISESSQGVDILITKIDSYGNRQWSKKYGGVGDDYAVGIAVSSAGEIFVGGYSNSTSAAEYDPYLLKLSGNGSFVDEQWYYYPGNDKIVDFSATSDDGFVLVGSSRASSDSTLGAQQYALLIKAGSDLTREWYSLTSGWSTCEGYKGSGSGITVTISADDRIIYGFDFTDWDYWGITMCGPSEDAAYVRIYDNDGTKIDYVALAGGVPNDFWNTGFMNWVLSSNGSTSIIGIYRKSIVSDYWLAEIDNSYHVVSDVSIALPSQYHLTDAAWLPQGVVIGADSSFKRFSTDGTLLGELSISSTFVLRIESFLATSDDKLLVTGRIDTPAAGWDALVFLIDPDF